MKVKFKKLNNKAVIPSYGTEGAAGLDMTAISKEIHYNKDGTLAFIEYDTGISLEIPIGFVGLVFPRSSVSKLDMSLANSVGVIDSDYRGSISFRFKTTSFMPGKQYEVGDRVGQLVVVPYPQIELEEVDTLNETQRGEGGYGSTNVQEKSQAW